MTVLDLLAADERLVVRTVREFADRDGRPAVREPEHADTSPEALVEGMKDLGVHGGYGHSTESDVERRLRDAPLMIVGEGTTEIRRNVIAAQLVARGGLDG